MTITIYDRVQETTIVSGTGNVTLLGASDGFRDFNSTVGVGNPTFYGIIDSANGIWEVGYGTLIDSTTLRRDGVYSSSNSNDPVSFLGAASLVFIDIPADQQIKRSELGTAAYQNIGSSADQIVQLDGSGKLPAVDGSQLTNLPAVLPIQTSSDPEVIIKNVAGRTILSTDSNGSTKLYNGQGIAVINVDNNYNLKINNVDDEQVFGIDDNGNPLFKNNSGNQIFTIDDSGQPKIYNDQGSGLIGVDGNHNLEIKNASGNHIFAMDSSGNPYIYNTQGVDVFSIDGSGNAVISSGSAPGFDAGFFGFDSSFNPRMINHNGTTVFSVDSSSGQPVIGSNVYPTTDSFGMLANDGEGNLSWTSRYKSVNAQTGATYTLANTDQMVTLNRSSAITLTVPAFSDVNFEPFVEISLLQLGIGQVTIQAADGVTVNSYLNKVNMAGQYAGATLKMLATDVWILIGNLA